MKTKNISKNDMLKRISFFKKSMPLPIQMDQTIPQEGKDIVYARELLSVIVLLDKVLGYITITRHSKHLQF